MNRTSCDDLSVTDTSREFLFVFVAFFVLIEQATDRGVSPIDDAKTVAESGGPTQEDVACLAGFLETEMCEIGGVDVHFFPIPSQPDLIQGLLASDVVFRSLIYLFNKLTKSSKFGCLKPYDIGIGYSLPKFFYYHLIGT